MSALIASVDDFIASLELKEMKRHFLNRGAEALVAYPLKKGKMQKFVEHIIHRCQKSEIRGQISEVRGQRSEVRKVSTLNL